MPDASPLTPLQQAVIALRSQRARIAELEAAGSAPIAVVGMACRYPAGADTPAALWEAVRDGRDGSREVPKERWDIDALYDPTPGRAGKMYVRNSCFIDRVDGFEPLFFRISPREAIGIDPQQRLLLETTWEALEDAAIPPPSLVGSQTGVFVGISTNDYSALLSRTAHGSGSNASAGAGNAASVASGRLSYTFGFQGPCLAVDTACSSSLVATHLAVQALRNRECNLAVVAGVNLMLTPDITVNFCLGRMLSPDGHCKTFDEAADGYARGEGCGVVVLKRLSEAVADGDRVLAVVRGSALGQDGRSAGFTAPNGLAQEAVIRKALANAGMAPEGIDYIEAHGTGTALGDPIEMHALKAVFKKRDRPLHVGSVKTNIGHTEAAAGVAGLIKAIGMLRNQALPPTLHFRRLNPHIDLGGVDIRVPTDLTPSEIRAIGVSSFGFSGTNAHIVLERAETMPQTTETPAGTPRLVISARTEEALRELIGRYRDHLAHTADSFADICHTAATGRARLPWWIAVGSAEELATARPSNAPMPALPATAGRKTALPLVPFQRERFWIDTSTTETAPVAADIDDGLPPLLGRKLSLPFSGESRWEAAVSSHHPALGFLAEHQVNGVAVMPAAGFVEMALAALPGTTIADLEIPAPLPISDETPRLVQTIAAADGTFRIVSCAADGSDAQLHASGHTGPRGPAPPPAPVAAGGTPLDTAELYAAMAQRGVSHGPAFRLLDNVRRADGIASATRRARHQHDPFGAMRAQPGGKRRSEAAQAARQPAGIGAQAPLRHSIYVPRVISSLSSKRVLVIEEVPGVLMSHYIRARREEPDVANLWELRNGIDVKALARDLAVSVLRQILEDNQFHGDLHPGNLIMLADNGLALIDFGSVGRLDRRLWMLYRDSLSAIAMRDYERAADIMLMMSPMASLANTTALRRDMTVAMRQWEMAGQFSGASYTDRSIAAMSERIAKVMAKHHVPLAWGIMRVGRTLSTLDASLQTLWPNADFLKLCQAYFRDRARRGATLQGRLERLQTMMMEFSSVAGDARLLLGSGLREQALRFHGVMDRVTHIRMVIASWAVRLGWIMLIVIGFSAYIDEGRDRLEVGGSWPLAKLLHVEDIAGAVPDLHPFQWLGLFLFAVFLIRFFRATRRSIAGTD